MDCRSPLKNHRPVVSQSGLQILRRALQSDSILISIDFENTINIRRGFTTSNDCQAGLAILDTRDLQHKYRPPEDLITTHNFVTGSPFYVSKAAPRFLFGESSVIKPANLLTNIQSIIPQDRDVVLLGYAVQNDIKALHGLGFDFSRFTSTFVIVDTCRVAGEVFGAWRGALGDLLLRIHCPFKKLHSGGNDANFTLRASLLLATREYNEMDNATSNYLQQISTSPISCLENLENLKAAAARKKEKKRERRRKRQAKPRTIEQQTRLRAERAAKKETAASDCIDYSLVFLDMNDYGTSPTLEGRRPRTPVSEEDRWFIADLETMYHYDPPAL
ncbi:Polynucleotidyl transferase [Nemania abortiva]|nr:Polynucleotidyl transferase [Nemania abortiva]